MFSVFKALHIHLHLNITYVICIYILQFKNVWIPGINGLLYVLLYMFFFYVLVFKESFRGFYHCQADYQLWGKNQNFFRNRNLFFSHNWLANRTYILAEKKNRLLKM